MPTEAQIRFKQQVRTEQILAGTWVDDALLPRYYVWVERPRNPDFAGGEPPLDWEREDRGGHL